MSKDPAKVREVQARRVAARRGLRLTKSRWGDDRGSWYVLTEGRTELVAGGPGTNLEDIEAWLAEKVRTSA